MASYKTIQVHVGGDERAGVRVDLAAGLARDFDAHLIGVHVYETLDAMALAFSAPYGGAAIPPELLERDEEEAKAAEAAARALFEQRTKAAGLAAEWRSYRGSYSDIIAMNARYADLTVAGQGAPEGTTAPSERYLPEDVVLRAGRPVLVVPYAGNFATLGKRVLIAWNASREATRAVADALPLLARAERVTALAVNPERGAARRGDVPVADIALYLSRHGVKAEAAETVAKDIDVGDVILSRAADLGADLIVSGAYGHSRLREYVLGGVTRDLLARMTAPVLLSH